jgi:hypothetical protein
MQLSKEDKKGRRNEAKAAGKSLQQGLLEPDTLGESAAAYEQQLKENPDSSLLWIKYMAFQLKLGEVTLWPGGLTLLRA